jgi:beta-lactam-binding protein with PASTA domain
VSINRPGLCNVQRFAGMTLAAAKQTLAHVNCRLGKVLHTYSKRVKKGRIISPRPRLGEVRRHGGRVDLVVSRGRKR